MIKNTNVKKRPEGRLQDVHSFVLSTKGCFLLNQLCISLYKLPMGFINKK